MNKIKITEYLDLDPESETWCCDRCGGELAPAREHYLKGCLVYDRPAGDIYGASIELAPGELVRYAPDPGFNRILEFYCPHCATMLEVQYLPPGHPIPRDIELNLDGLKAKYRRDRS